MATLLLRSPVERAPRIHYSILLGNNEFCVLTPGPSPCEKRGAQANGCGEGQEIHPAMPTSSTASQQEQHRADMAAGVALAFAQRTVTGEMPWLADPHTHDEGTPRLVEGAGGVEWGSVGRWHTGAKEAVAAGGGGALAAHGFRDHAKSARQPDCRFISEIQSDEQAARAQGIAWWEGPHPQPLPRARERGVRAPVVKRARERGAGDAAQSGDVRSDVCS